MVVGYRAGAVAWGVPGVASEVVGSLVAREGGVAMSEQHHVACKPLDVTVDPVMGLLSLAITGACLGLVLAWFAVLPVVGLLWCCGVLK